MPGLHLWGFFTPPVAGADLPATLVANCLLGALPPVEASSDADAIAGASVGAISDADADADASSDADVIAGTLPQIQRGIKLTAGSANVVVEQVQIVGG